MQRSCVSAATSVLSDHSKLFYLERVWLEAGLSRVGGRPRILKDLEPDLGFGSLVLQLLGGTKKEFIEGFPKKKVLGLTLM